jgi:putative ABC transport system permease protein
MSSQSSRRGRFFRLMLRAFPFEFRSDYGRDMEQLFRLQRGEAEGGGPMSVVRLWFHTIAGVVRVAPRQHLAMLGQDLRYALRTMRRHPAFTIVAVATLALGIGVTTAMFSVAHATLLRPLPYPDADRLVAIHERQLTSGADIVQVSYPNYLTLRDAARTLERIAVVRFSEVVLRGSDDPARIGAAFASPDLFDVLRVRPALGRNFAEQENRPGAPLTAIVSHRFWVERLGADPKATERSVVILGAAAAIVGVMPRGFAFPSPDTDIWLPIGLVAAERPMTNRAVHMTLAVGRLRRDVTLEQARQELAAVGAAIERDHPGEDPRHSLTALPLHEQMVGSMQPAIVALCGAVGFVLLVACVNVAHLMLARGATRQKETAIRKALGATRFRLVRQLLTESLVVALIGGALGLIVAAWSMRLIVDKLPAPLPGADAIGLDGRVLAFAFAVSVSTGLLFGLSPAFRASRVDPHDDLKEGAGRLGGLGNHRLRSLLVVAEIAASLVLVAGAGLMLKSFWLLHHVPLGFRPERLVTMRVALPAGERYRTEEAVVRFYRELPGTLARINGVEAVSAVNQLPVSGGDGHGVITVEHRDFPTGEAPSASFRRVLPNYFRAMGVPLLRGREFDAHDIGADPNVVIISEAMAKRVWAADDPVGQRIKIGPPENEPWLTVVGVVGDVHNVSLDSEPALDTYEPHAQRPWTTMNLLVRTRGETTPVMRDVRTELRRIEPGLLVDRMATMEERLGASVAPQRLNVLLLGVFAAFALTLAAIGIYGLTSYTVVQRTREIGIRMALGADRPHVLGDVLGRALKLALWGIAIGVPAALAVTRVIRQLLFEVQPTDVATFCAVATGMAAVTLFASWIPALRATRVDPMLALRSE